MKMLKRNAMCLKEYFRQFRFVCGTLINRDALRQGRLVEETERKGMNRLLNQRDGCEGVVRERESESYRIQLRCRVGFIPLAIFSCNFDFTLQTSVLRPTTVLKCSRELLLSLGLLTLSSSKLSGAASMLLRLLW